MEIKILTLVIPTKNRFELLKKILVEIKKFKKEIDIIIVDDNSSVHVSKLIIDLIKEFKNIRYFKLKKNKGQSFACNYGLKRCKSKYVWFFDDDDFLKKTTLKTLIHFLYKKDIEGVLLPMEQVYKGKKFKTVFPKSNDHLFKQLKNSSQKVSTSCAIFSSKIIRDIGGWDDNLFAGTDTDLFLRFSRVATFNVINTYPVIVNFSGPLRVTNNFYRQQNAKIYILKKHWNILTLKRKFYYIISYILCFSLLNNIKAKFKILGYKL